MRIQDVPQESRPYECFLEKGARSVTNIQLLAILLRSGTKEYNVQDLSKHILSLYSGEPSLLSLYQLSYEQLLKVKGIGKVKAIQLLAVLELARRLSKERYKPQKKIDSPQSIAKYFMEDLRHDKEEHFMVTFLDAKCKLLGYEDISKGSLTASIVHPREVYRAAIRHAAHSVIAVHNHPSGDPKPSQEDIKITKRLQKAGEIVGIPLLDHIIIGDRQYISFKEESYL